MRVIGIALLALLVAGAPAANAKPQPLKSKHGNAPIAFDLAFGLKLVQAGATPSPIAPATMDGTTFTFPVKSAKVNGKGTRATIKLRGGQKLSEDYTVRTITHLVAKIRGRKLVVLADAGGNSLGAKGLPFLRGRGKGTLAKNGYTFTATKLTLTALAAADTNAQFNTTAFKAGEPVGKGTFLVARRK